MKRRHISAMIWTALLASCAFAQQDPLKYDFNGQYGQVEVGGPYAGMEFHNSRPAPSRISFFAPVANSIDLSTDYWQRGRSLPMAIGLRLGGGEVEWISRQSWSYTLSPHCVTFRKATDSLSFSISYEFCQTAPAAVFTVTARNVSGKMLPVEIYTHLILSLRTCQTYSRHDSSMISYDGAKELIWARFNERATDRATIFVQNVGEPPVAFALRASDLSCTDSGGSAWPAVKMIEARDSLCMSRANGVAAFVYRKTLAPNDSLGVVQVIGSSRGSETAKWASQVRSHWRNEVRDYDDFIRTKAERSAQFSTGDTMLDRSATWARGLIAANAHNLNGLIVPMPCPAEYNFFFTHDLLLTNLGAVHFDLGRVKRDLLYVISLAKDSVIPHAYYWRDDGYKTEYCEPENWNHLWFILASGSYMRHSLDDSTGRILHPFLKKSLAGMLTRLRSDGLMHAFRPDWWDIGHIEGPRTYLTALAIRALREYVFICSKLSIADSRMLEYERTADRMQQALVEHLWDAKQNYLTNFNEGVKDDHLYAGSLIASVYGLIDSGRSEALVRTAERSLVEQRIGLRIAWPPDFDQDSIIAKYKFAGKEAGPAYAYANGGVWPHGNAWYAMALAAIGKPDESLVFIRRTMTLDGIARSPNGVPAMYEYRYSNPASPEFGNIDKPSFLWAGGMYLQALYRLFAMQETEWNLRINAHRPSTSDSIACTITFGAMASFNAMRIIDDDGLLVADGRVIPSRIMPLEHRDARRWEMRNNTTHVPVLDNVNAILHSAAYDPNTKRFTCDISSFPGHRIECIVVGNRPVRRVFVDGVQAKGIVSADRRPGMIANTVHTSGTTERQRIVFEF